MKESTNCFFEKKVQKINVKVLECVLAGTLLTLDNKNELVSLPNNFKRVEQQSVFEAVVEVLCPCEIKNKMRLLQEKMADNGQLFMLNFTKKEQDFLTSPSYVDFYEKLRVAGNSIYSETIVYGRNTFINIGENLEAMRILATL